MAGNLHVSNLEDDLIPRLKRRAARHGSDADGGRSLYREISGAGRGDAQLGDRTAKQSIRRQIAADFKLPNASERMSGNGPLADSSLANW